MKAKMMSSMKAKATQVSFFVEITDFKVDKMIPSSPLPQNLGSHHAGVTRGVPVAHSSSYPFPHPLLITHFYSSSYPSYASPSPSPPIPPPPHHHLLPPFSAPLHIMPASLWCVHTVEKSGRSVHWISDDSVPIQSRWEKWIGPSPAPKAPGGTSWAPEKNVSHWLA